MPNKKYTSIDLFAGYGGRMETFDIIIRMLTSNIENRDKVLSV